VSIIINQGPWPWWVTLVVSAWGIGLLPPLLIRFAFAKHALLKPSAVTVAVVLWIFNVVVFTTLGSASKTHAALLLVAWVSYAILRMGSARYEAQIAHDAAERNRRVEEQKAQAEQKRCEEERQRAEDAQRQADEARRREEEVRREGDRRRAEEEGRRNREEQRRRTSSGTTSNRAKDERLYAARLGLRGATTPHDVKRRYRELAAQYHPDKVNHLGSKLKEVAAQEMKEINEAYEYFKRKYGIG